MRDVPVEIGKKRRVVGVRWTGPDSIAGGASEDCCLPSWNGGSTSSGPAGPTSTTSQPASHGAGRYLDLEPEEDGTYVLDFNLAYHPSCVYDMRFSCPLTPAENRLPFRIEAGERLAEAHEA